MGIQGQRLWGSINRKWDEKLEMENFRRTTSSRRSKNTLKNLLNERWILPIDEPDRIRWCGSILGTYKVGLGYKSKKFH